MRRPNKASSAGSSASAAASAGQQSANHWASHRLTFCFVVLAVTLTSAVWASGASAISLPDGRAYEMVSPPDKNGGSIVTNATKTRAAAGGDAAMFSSLAGFGDVSGMGVSAEYLSVRSTNPDPGDNGWTTHGITPVQESLTYTGNVAGLEPRYEGEMSDDLTTGIFRALTPLTADPMVANATNFYRRDDLMTPGNGTYQLVSPCPLCVSPLPALSKFSKPWFAGTSADFAHVLFESPLNLAPGASGANPRLYEWVDGTLRLAGVLPNGTLPARSLAGQGASKSSYTKHVISADGSRIFFIVPPNGSATSGPLYARIEGRTSVQLNASERTAPDSVYPATYWDASTDGKRVFFTSQEALIDDAPVGGDDKLYMWALQPTDEVQTVTVSATDGTFTLTLGGVTTAPVPAGADAGVLQAALEALPTVGTGNVAVTGGPGNAGGTTPYQVTFRGDLAGTNVAQMTADGASLTGGAGTATVATSNAVSNLTYLSAGNDVRGVIGASDYGHYVYFAAHDGLQPGVFLWHDGDVAYVGAITAITTDLRGMTGEGSYVLNVKQAEVTSDGRHLLLNASVGTGLLSAHGGVDYDHGSCPGDGFGGPCREFYVYSADSDTLACATCIPGGAPATASADARTVVQSGGAEPTAYLSRPLSDDGRYVFFSTREALVPEDVNNRYDAYEYDVAAGKPYLLSSGTSTSNSYVLDASANGDDVFVATREQLVGWDVDQAYDLYDARVDGGFPEPPPASASGCTGDACQGDLSAAPSVAGAVTGAFRGTGNANATTRSTISGLRKLSSSDRSTLAKGGKARLRLKVNGSGTVTVTGTTKLGKKNRRVVSSRATAKKAGAVSVPFALSKSALSALSRKGSLTVRLTVRFKDARPKVVSFTLKSATSKKGGRS